MAEIIAVRPEDNFEYWHHVTCRQFSRTECTTAADDEFRARVSIRNFGELFLDDIWSVSKSMEPVQVERRRRDIRGDQQDCFMFWLMLGGSAELHQNGHSTMLRTGEMVLQDQARPFTLRFGQKSHAIMVTIPRPLLEARLHGVERMAAHKISRSARMAPMASAMVLQMFDLAAKPVSTNDRRIGASALDILTATLDTEIGQASLSTRSERRLDEVKDYMLANLGNCELDVDAIARDKSITPRTLYRLFSRYATTPIQWLWDQRLDAAYKLLSDGSAARVTDVALLCGFKDLSHFSKAFRARFGKSPSFMRDARGERDM